MSTWELTNITAQLVLPPMVFILLALVGLAMVRSRMRFGAGLALFSVLAVMALSMPIVGRALVRSLETPFADPALDRKPAAIVILGGGSYPAAPEYGGDTVSRATLERLRYGAHLHRRTGKPVLVTGGSPAGTATSEGEQMRDALRDFGVATKWVEARSSNTFESARYTARALRAAGVQSIYLVTHAWHMPRARLAFERAGLHVVPAAHSYKSVGRLTPLDFIPHPLALAESYIFFHEVLGMLWYRIKFDVQNRTGTESSGKS